jgi:hypothetical protein
MRKVLGDVIDALAAWLDEVTSPWRLGGQLPMS